MYRWHDPLPRTKARFCFFCLLLSTRRWRHPGPQIHHRKTTSMAPSESGRFFLAGGGGVRDQNVVGSGSVAVSRFALVSSPEAAESRLWGLFFDRAYRQERGEGAFFSLPLSFSGGLRARCFVAPPARFVVYPNVFFIFHLCFFCLRGLRSRSRSCARKTDRSV